MAAIENTLRRADIFAEDLSEDFFCTICQGVLFKSRQCKEGHTFCEGCIHDWLLKHFDCPVCRMPLSRAALSTNRLVDNIMGKMQVRCIHGRDVSTNPKKKIKMHKYGPSTYCHWTGSHSEIIVHLERDCIFERVDCVNKDKGCCAKLTRREMEDGSHACSAVCPDCKDTFHVQTMSDHKSICTERKTGCVHPGCGAKVLRKDMYSHEAACVHAPLDCPFAVHGCTVGKIRRRAMKRHQVDAAVAHSLLLAERVMVLQDRVEDSGAQLLRAVRGEKVKVRGACDKVEWVLNYDELKKKRENQPNNPALRAFCFSHFIFIPSFPDSVFRAWAEITAEGLGLFFTIKGGLPGNYPIRLKGSRITCSDRSETLDNDGNIKASGESVGWSTFFEINEADARAVKGQLQVTLSIRATMEVDILDQLKRKISSNDSST
jgi:hypothetical protein